MINITQTAPQHLIVPIFLCGFVWKVWGDRARLSTNSLLLGGLCIFALWSLAIVMVFHPDTKVGTGTPIRCSAQTQVRQTTDEIEQLVSRLTAKNNLLKQQQPDTMSLDIKITTCIEQLGILKGELAEKNCERITNAINNYQATYKIKANELLKQ